MVLIRRSSEAYAELLHKLQPLGVIWPERGGGTLDGIYQALAQQLAQVDGRLVDLLGELDPDQAFEMLAEWESDLGIPEPCRTLAGPVPERRAAILSKLKAEGAYNSRQWLVDLAAELGFVVTVAEFTPSEFLAGQSRAGDVIEGGWYRQIFRVDAPLTSVRLFRAGTGRAGERLVEFGNDLLECVLRASKPAHVQVIFAYS